MLIHIIYMNFCLESIPFRRVCHHRILMHIFSKNEKAKKKTEKKLWILNGRVHSLYNVVLMFKLTLWYLVLFCYIVVHSVCVYHSLAKFLAFFQLFIVMIPLKIMFMHGKQARRPLRDNIKLNVCCCCCCEIYIFKTKTKTFFSEWFDII